MEREQRNVINEVLHLTLFFFFGIIVIAGVMMFVTDPVQAAQAGSDAGMATGLGYLAAALSTGLSCVGGGIAVASAASAAWEQSVKIQVL